MLRRLLIAARLCHLRERRRAADPDPDLQAVQAVCGRCHTTAVFLNKPRSWDRWNDVFADMTKRGANGTDEQLERVTTYFLENLTLVNVNTSPADELAGVLGVSDDVAAGHHRAPAAAAVRQHRRTARGARRGSRQVGATEEPHSFLTGVGAEDHYAIALLGWAATAILTHYGRVGVLQSGTRWRMTHRKTKGLAACAASGRIRAINGDPMLILE